MKVYKVVRRERKGLVSVFAGGKANVRYKPQEWVKAPEWLRERGYDILAFMRISDAKRWVRGIRKVFGDKLEIWEAEADTLRTPPKILDFTLLGQGIMSDWNSYWPSGTVMCRKIKLLRRVWPEVES